MKKTFVGIGFAIRPANGIVLGRTDAIATSEAETGQGQATGHRHLVHVFPAVFAAHLAQIAVDFAITAAGGLHFTVALVITRLGGRAMVKSHGNDVLAARLFLHLAFSSVDVAVGSAHWKVRLPLLRARFHALIIGSDLHARADMS